MIVFEFFTIIFITICIFNSHFVTKRVMCQTIFSAIIGQSGHQKFEMAGPCLSNTLTSYSHDRTVRPPYKRQSRTMVVLSGQPYVSHMQYQEPVTFAATRVYNLCVYRSYTNRNTTQGTMVCPATLSSLSLLAHVRGEHSMHDMYKHVHCYGIVDYRLSLMHT